LTAQLSPTDFVRALGQAETGSDQSEAYAFRTQDGKTNVYVAWTNDDQFHNMRLATTTVVVVDKLGGESVISDGDDGAVDGHVTVTLGPSPLYLRFATGAVR
jgi:hypothetical protein